ncbi:MAG: (2Fe-2S)-binding protein [Candidatus Cloacimonetes bacterium]|nr:(2Fe-2S)-binding protein [Candidatus Cloacimonadota bacterium]
MAETVTINRHNYQITDAIMERQLLDWLREDLDLTGTKNGCNIGVCGACTILVDGAPRRACKLLLKDVTGKDVITIEGLTPADGSLHPVQQAFVDAGAIQCGFCTPGMVLTAYALLKKCPQPTPADIRQAIKGNLCRCTGYQQIIDAVMLAADRMTKQKR